jgi:protein involved in polysaccharide export with SLBB domain
MVHVGSHVPLVDVADALSTRQQTWPPSPQFEADVQEPPPASVSGDE